MNITLTLPFLLTAAIGCETASANSVGDVPADNPSPASSRAQSTSTLNVTVKGLRSTEGGLFVFLYDSEDSFPKKFEDAVQTKRRRTLSSDSTTVRFKELEPGTYALLVFHDENDNGEMDKNMLGLPKEGVGASNVKKGKPKWSQAKFTLDEHRNVTVSMQYF